jgi:hypothetical protein
MRAPGRNHYAQYALVAKNGNTESRLSIEFPILKIKVSLALPRVMSGSAGTR